MIGLCTDSNSQVTPDLVRRYGIEVVPLTVILDGKALLEGVDIDPDTFWARFSRQVSTAAPSPGQFAAAYDALAGRGATEILSVHVSEQVSSTVQAARLAASRAPVAVTVVDSGTSSFGVSYAIWEAAEALADGAGLTRAAEVASRVGASTQNVFVVSALDPARQGGRLGQGAPSGPGVPVLSMIGGSMTVLCQTNGLEAAVDAMAERISPPGGRPRRVAVGVSDPATQALASALEGRLRSSPGVVDLHRYRIGPSVGAHTGPGTVGAYYHLVSS